MLIQIIFQIYMYVFLTAILVSSEKGIKLANCDLCPTQTHWLG